MTLLKKSQPTRFKYRYVTDAKNKSFNNFFNCKIFKYRVCNTCTPVKGRFKICYLIYANDNHATLRHPRSFRFKCFTLKIKKKIQEVKYSCCLFEPIGLMFFWILFVVYTLWGAI